MTGDLQQQAGDTDRQPLSIDNERCGRKVFTEQEWNAEGERRFGPQRLKWRFECPACHHVQSPEDFRPFKDKPGVTAETATFNCIGRYSGAKPNAGLDGNGKAKGPCNYTSGGLFDLRPVTVTMPDGEDIRVFAFANEEGGKAS